MLYVLFGLLFLYERKAINILIAYIGMTITMAIIVANNDFVRVVEGEYLSYILILVQVSALTILFGFIIMLYPRSSFPTSTPYPLPPRPKDEGVKRRVGWGLMGLALLLISFVLLFYPTPQHFGNLENLEYNHRDIHLLRTLGEQLYTHDLTILKLLVVTLILLVAIIGLFFLISF